jgi:uncharacterized protein (UPF0212 family)
MLSIKNHPRKKPSFLDGAIAINDIYPTLLHIISSIAGENGDSEVRGLGLGWPIVGGQVACLKAEDCIAIGGLDSVIRIFEEIENDKLKDIQYIECHSCPMACVGGTLTIENPYIARGRVLRMVERFGAEPCQDRDKIRSLYQKNFFSLPGKITPQPVHPLDEDISIAIQKMQKKQETHEMLPQIDCGACGAPTCLSFAEDVVMDRAVVDDCVFIAMRKFEKMSSDLFETVLRHSRRIQGHMEVS